MTELRHVVADSLSNTRQQHFLDSASNNYPKNTSPGTLVDFCIIVHFLTVGISEGAKVLLFGKWKWEKNVSILNLKMEERA